MDYSTISNKTNCTEAEDLTNGELTERYFLLKKQYENLSRSYETTKQELHESKRSHQTTLDVLEHLNAELESLQAEDERRKNEMNNRVLSLQEQISQLREERAQTLENHATEIKKLESHIQNLKEELSVKTRESPVRDNSELDETRAALNCALSEAEEAKAALEEAQMEAASWRMRSEELGGEMAEIRAAAESRREELRAAVDREAVLMGDLAEARAMLHQCTDSQDVQPHAAKGNSIFAEVEDKRQEMAKNLIQMKQTNSRLRRELANKQVELDALLHEKQNIWEQQAGASAHHDQELIESYEERITQLEGVCERQRRELARWFVKLSEPPANGWLPGVLDHLKSECEQLRAEVLSCGAAQLASAAQIRDLRRKLALTANKQSTPPSKNDTNVQDHSVHIAATQPVVRKIDDARKKVSFN